MLIGAVALVAACSATSSRSGFDDGTDGGAGDEGGTGPKIGGGDNSGEGGGGCQGIGCKVTACSNGKPTSLTGQVFDPAGKNPLYNIIVYIPTDPNAALPPITQGMTCDKCGATALNPVVSTLTDENGMFTLKGVPTMKGVPVVIQVGKWRKKVTFDVTADCAENKFTDKLTLPKNGTEGDMPQIAVTTGGCDALECLLSGMGIDESEFVQGDDPKGHVHMYKGSGGATGVDAQSKLWSDTTALSKYDVVALSCECDEHNENKPTAAKQAMYDYINAGGRIFATHYHYTWFSNSPQADFKGVANWTPNGFGGGSSPYNVEQGFPKGKAFAQWLKNVNASTTLGKIPLDSVSSDLTNVNTTTSQAWIDSSASAVKYFTFNAPIGTKPENQCGRAVYSDLHVSGTGGTSVAPFPAKCSPAPGKDLSPQQKALEFMVFDLSSCVQADSTPPTPPK
jgi:hypothetical protein